VIATKTNNKKAKNMSKVYLETKSNQKLLITFLFIFEII
jgi:hypothetical protein